MELSEGRIPMNDAETAAVDGLVAGKTHCQLSRRDPGETGPVLVEADGVAYEVSPDGMVMELHG